MKLFKFAIFLSVFVLISTVVWAGNTPEYDAVGCDINNYFAQTCVYYQLVNCGRNAGLEQDSAFFCENFETNSGQLQPNPCYGIDSGLTDAWNEGTYEWWIVLQMKPESDIDLNIYDCVLKHNEFDIWTGADQTGRYRQPWGELVFEPTGNPLVSASAIPGPYATSGFREWHYGTCEELILDARTMPGLVSVALDGVPYTSKANFPEGLVVVMPDTGLINESGQSEWNLKQGDIIHVTVKIPDNANTVDVWYGPDSVILKYIGIIYTEYFVSLGDFDTCRATDCPEIPSI